MFHMILIHCSSDIYLRYFSSVNDRNNLKLLFECKNITVQMRAVNLWLAWDSEGQLEACPSETILMNFSVFGCIHPILLN